MAVYSNEVSVRRRRLPHWEMEGGNYFVTFRLAGSIPADVLEQAKAEADGKLTPAARKQHLRRWLEQYLDQDREALLRNPQCAQVVQDCLLFWHTKRYRLIAWCVMPNHVHVVMRVLPTSSLEAITHTWKSFTAHEINTLLGQGGAVWQREYFDRLLRNEEELAKTVRYVLNNPVKAGLRDWKFVGEVK